MNPTPRILVIDDEPIFLDIIAELLSDTGYDIETEDQSLRAWARLEQAPDAFDIVLLDWQMPDLDGLECLRRIKASPALRHLTVIMQTSLCDKARVAEGLAAGAFYYLVKPFEQQELVAIVNAAVADRRQIADMEQRLAADRRALGALHAARFVMRTLDEARELAIFIANVCPEPQRVVLGLTELLINAVEHGNLELSYADKSRLLETGRLHEEIALRLADPRYCTRTVTIEFHRRATAIEIDIIDEGPGFSWDPYLEFDPERAFHAHGRGIAMARKLCFDNLAYRGRGNAVTVTMKLAESAMSVSQRPLAIAAA